MIFLGILLFALLIVVHEFGHFLVAKRNGVDVEEFGIGFPPRLFGKKMGRGIWRSYYSFNLLPLGGFVRLKGENEADKSRGSFGATSFWVKTKITAAGVGMNYVVAIVLLAVVAAIRLPVLLDNQFTIAADTTELRRDVIAAVVAEDSPAEAAGLMQGDVIISLDGEELISSEQLPGLASANAGRQVDLVVNREGQDLTLTPTLDAEPQDGRSYLGVGPQDIVERRSTWSAPIVGFVVTHQIAWETLRLLGEAVVNLIGGDGKAASESVAGPVGIFAILRNITTIAQLLLITSVISLSLAIMNAMPIPALDGGRLALSGIFKLLRRPLTPRVENAVHNTGFVALIILLIAISVVDFRRFF